MTIPSKRTPSKYPVVNGVMTYPDGREVCQMNTAAGKREYKERTRKMCIRQGFLDAITGQHMHTWEATFDHQAGRTVGKRDDRIIVDGEWHNAALGLQSNMQKGSRRYHWQDGKYVPVSAGERTEEL